VTIGDGVYGKVLRENNFTNTIIKRDLCCGEIKENYLLNNFTNYDLLFTNIHMHKNVNLFKNCISQANYFVCDALRKYILRSTKRFTLYGVHVFVLYPRPKFNHKGKIV
jgi:hypothetical protein